MKNWKQLIGITTVTAFLLVGCSSDGGDGDDGTPSSITEENAGEFLKKVEATVPGCTYVENTAAVAHYTAALPAVVENVRYSTAFDVIMHAPAAQSEELNCTNTVGAVDGKIVMTSNADQTEISAEFQNCHLGFITGQETKINGQLNLGLTVDPATMDYTSITASTGPSGITVIDTNVSQNVTLALTGFNITMNEASQSSPTTVTLGHFGVTDNLNSSESFRLDNCSASGYEDTVAMQTHMNLAQCSYTDKDGTFSVSSNDIVVNNTGEINGAVTVLANDGTSMVFTLTDSVGEATVKVNGADYGTLDCREFSTDGITLPL